MEDDIYKGYRIAKGTTVLVNFWYVFMVYSYFA